MATTANCAAIRIESTTLTRKIEEGLIFAPHSVGGKPWLYSFRGWPLAALVIIAAACVAGSPRTVWAETIGSFSIEKIVDANTPRPDGKGNFQNPLSPSTDGTSVVFNELRQFDLVRQREHPAFDEIGGHRHPGSERHRKVHFFRPSGRALWRLRNHRPQRDRRFHRVRYVRGRHLVGAGERAAPSG